MNILLSWLGTRDIDNMLQDKFAAIAAVAVKSEKPFDKIVILANQREEVWSEFENFIQKRLAFAGRPTADVAVKQAHIESPIDYPSIARETEKWVGKLSDEADRLTINLTSGTPAMTVLSVLVGKGKSNVHFIQVSPDNELIAADIPLDFGREYIRSAAKNQASGAVANPKLANAFSSITALSSEMQQVITKAKRVAASEVPALILGETGTGKEEMAKAIHKASLRVDKPMKTVNCGALAPTLIESTLFGHKKGAFTGADNNHPGLFEQADGGTLFLDEVGELSLDVQVKLLRAIQQGEVTPLGSTETKTVDVRVIAATHQNLQRLVSEGKFREDLFYRLAVGIITVPSLKQRLADIPAIVAHLTEQINKAGAKHPAYVSKEISEDGIKFICEQPWPGNIRELWSTLNRAFLWSDSPVVNRHDLSQVMLTRPAASDDVSISLTFNDKIDIVQLTDNFQKKYVEAALKASGNVKKHATQMLGLKDHQTLTNWMKRLGISTEK